MSAKGNGAPGQTPAGAARTRHAARGFTLIEILVVLLICVGLVTLVAALYRSVGKSAIALRGGEQEWKLQQQMRGQMLHLFVEPAAFPAVGGHPAEIYFASWHSGAAAMDGKPVLAYYQYIASERALYYREHALPFWGRGAAPAPASALSDILPGVRAAPPRKILTGVESLTFSYLQKGAPDIRPEHWGHEWRDPGAPLLIQIQFNKAGRNYSILFETRGTDA